MHKDVWRCRAVCSGNLKKFFKQRECMNGFVRLRDEEKKRKGVADGCRYGLLPPILGRGRVGP